jgi:hypothetical protein
MAFDRKEYYKKWRAKHPAYRADYYQKNKEKETEQTLAWRKANPEKVEAMHKKWWKEHPEKYRQKLARINKRLREKAKTDSDYRKKFLAWRIAEEIPMTECVKCGSKDNLQRHHPDYDKPDEIIVLCDFCHKSEHKRLRKARDE